MSLQILTGNQQRELNRALLQYLQNRVGENSDPEGLLEGVSRLLDTPLDSPETEKAIIPNYLEKKWSTVLRLQKRIIDLENDLSNYKQLLEATNSAESTTIVSRDKIHWLPKNAQKTFRLLAQQLVQTVAIHPGLPVVLCGCSDGSLITWNLVNDDTIIPDKNIKAHTRAINRIRWSPEPIDITGKAEKAKVHVLASCSADLSIKIWDGDSYKQLRSLTGHEHTVSAIAFSPNKPTVLYSVSRDKTVKVWDLVNGYCTKSFVGHSDWVRDIDVVSINAKLLLHNIAESSELGDFLVTCSNDQSVRLSHGESGTGLALLIGHTHVIETVRFLPVYSAPVIDKYLKDNSLNFPEIPVSLVEDAVYTETLGYKYCLSGGRDNTIKLWLLPSPVLRAHRHPLPSTQHNSQGWLVADLVGHHSWVKTLDIHPNGRFVFSGSDDKTIKVWDLHKLNESGKVECIRTLHGHEGFVLDISSAGFNLDKAEEFAENTLSEERHARLMKQIEAKMRCLMVSGGVDNAVKLWS